MKYNKKILAVVFALVALNGSAFAEAKNSIMVKTGSFKMATKTQTIGSTVTFDETSSSIYSFEYERKMKNSMSWGAEFSGYKNLYEAGTGSSDSFHMMFNLRKYFELSKYAQPYIGGGLGASTVKLGGVGTGNGGGLGYQLMAGIKIPFTSVSFVAEYKMISAKPDDKTGTSVDISGNGIFAGVGFNF